MTTEQLNVSGMTCSGCVDNVTQALAAMPGVTNVAVSLPDHTATVKFDEGQTSTEAMRAAVRTAGYDIVETPVKPTAGGCCAS